VRSLDSVNTRLSTGHGRHTGAATDSGERTLTGSIAISTTDANGPENVTLGDASARLVSQLSRSDAFEVGPWTTIRRTPAGTCTRIRRE
jgi:hypothetical protein